MSYEYSLLQKLRQIFIVLAEFKFVVLRAKYLFVSFRHRLMTTKNTDHAFSAEYNDLNLQQVITILSN